MYYVSITSELWAILDIVTNSRTQTNGLVTLLNIPSMWQRGKRLLEGLILGINLLLERNTCNFLSKSLTWNCMAPPYSKLDGEIHPSFQWSCMDVRVGLWRKLSAEELMLLNCADAEDSWESLGLQGDPASSFWRRSALGFLWKEWC